MPVEQSSVLLDCVIARAHPTFQKLMPNLRRCASEGSLSTVTSKNSIALDAGSRQFPNSVTVRCFAFEPVDDEMSQNGRQKEHLIMFPKCL